MVGSWHDIPPPPRPRPKPFTWSRYAEIGAPGYEVSTQGDKRFSALHARVPGRGSVTIECEYQLGIKGYAAIATDWRAGKGKPALNGKTREQLWQEYLQLWRDWAAAHMDLMYELRLHAQQAGHHLTDAFATSEINQARALSIILTELQS